MTTLCINCKNVIIDFKGSVLDSTNALCTKSPYPEEIDYFDGVKRHYRTDSDGIDYFVDMCYHYCYEINRDGNCPEYELK